MPIEETTRADVLCTIRQLFMDSQSRDRESALRDLANSLGYSRLGPRIREVLSKDLLTAVRRGILQNVRGQMSLVTRDMRNYTRESLKADFLTALGKGWVNRDEAIRCFARFLGFARTGSNIEDISRSLIKGLRRESRLEGRADHIRRM